jgi:hypothetical protein
LQIALRHREPGQFGIAGNYASIERILSVVENNLISPPRAGILPSLAVDARANAPRRQTQDAGG